jgi:predicted phage terminase large subunit-like protein
MALIDDPANTQDVTSEAERNSVINWYSQSLSTRLNDPKTGVILLVMQRQHELDLTGFILNSEPEMWEHLVLRMRYESNPFLEYDRRGYDEEGYPLEGDELAEAEGLLLWPERVPEIEVQKLEKTLGTYGTSGQLQQRPEPKGGGIIKVEHWKMFPPADQQEDWKKDGVLCWPPLEFVVASCDLAFTEKQENDYSAMTVWGLWHDRTGAPKVIAMHAWQDRLSFNPLITRIGNNCRKFKPDVLLIEAKAAGISAAQEIQRVYGAAEWSTVLVNPKGDKVSRAISIQGLFEEGLIYAPDRVWAQLLIDTCASFPKGQHDDLVDSMTQALKWMRDNGIIRRKDEHSREVFDALPRSGESLANAPPYDV